jgi:hypothetical protein
MTNTIRWRKYTYMSVGHLFHLLDGGKAIQMALIRRRTVPTTQELVAPHQITWPDWPQLARAMARSISWAFTPFMAISRL